MAAAGEDGVRSAMKEEQPAAPDFVKPGDNPELDRLISELRVESERAAPPVGHDLFGRPRKAEARRAKRAAAASEAASGGRSRWRLSLLAVVAVIAPLTVLILFMRPWESGRPAVEPERKSAAPAASAAPEGTGSHGPVAPAPSGPQHPKEVAPMKSPKSSPVKLQASAAAKAPPRRVQIVEREP
jgi:hypothetical protein